MFTEINQSVNLTSYSVVHLMVTGYADQSSAQLTNLEICLLDNGSTAIAIARMLALNVDDPGP